MISTKYNKKILILGTTGMLGHQLYFFLKKKKYNLLGLCRGKKNIYKKLIDNNKFKKIDFNDLHKLEKIVIKFKPNYVINCAGIIKQKTNNFDKNQIFFINAYFPNFLSKLAIKKKFKFIHISTDCVFNGKKGNYSEKEQPNATDDYGLSKALGEVSSLNCLTLRTSIIGHEIYEKKGLLEWFLMQKKIFGYKNAYFSGLTTLELSKVIEKTFNKKIRCGIYNVSSKKISKYHLLLLINKIYANNISILPSRKVKIDRSLNGKLFEKISKIKISSWKKMILDLNKNYIKNIKNYEHF